MGQQSGEKKKDKKKKTKRRLSSLGQPPPVRRGCSNLSPPRGGVLRMQELNVALVGAQGCQSFLLYKPVVGQNIALDAVPAYNASILT